MAVRITPGSQVQDELSAAVKSVHCELRQKLLKGIDQSVYIYIYIYVMSDIS